MNANSRFAEEIVERVPMPEAAVVYGLEPNRSGFCRCPFHGEKDASFKVYPGSRGFYCFGCHKGGNVIDFVEAFFGLPFFQAIKKINEDFSLHLPIGEGLSRQDRQAAARAAFKRRKALQDRQAAIRRLDDNVDVAFDRWKRADDDASNFAPETPLDDYDPRFVAALRDRAAAEYELQCAEDERYSYGHK